MKKEIKFLLAAFSIFLHVFITACNGQTKLGNSENIGEVDSVVNHTEEEILSESKVDPYRLNINLDKKNENQFVLDVNLELDKGSYITSPFAIDMKGHYTVIIAENKHLILDDKITENPPCIAENFEWADTPTLINKVNTNYRQKIEVLNLDDFEVSGWIQFVIEPKCTMEKNEFVITKKDGVLNVKFK